MALRDVEGFESLWDRPMAAILPIDRQMPKDESTAKGNSELGRAYDTFVRELRSYNPDDLSLCVARAQESLSRSGGLANSTAEHVRARKIDHSDPRTLRLGAQLANLKRSPDAQRLLSELYETGDRSAELATLLSEATELTQNAALLELVQAMARADPQVLVLVDGTGQTIVIDPDNLSLISRSERVTSPDSRIIGAFFSSEIATEKGEQSGLIFATDSGQLLDQNVFGNSPKSDTGFEREISWVLPATEGGTDVLLIGGGKDRGFVVDKAAALDDRSLTRSTLKDARWPIHHWRSDSRPYLATVELEGELHVVVVDGRRGHGEVWTRNGPEWPLHLPRTFHKSNEFDRFEEYEQKASRRYRFQARLIADPWHGSGLLYFSRYGAERLDLESRGFGDWEPFGKGFDMSGTIEAIATIRCRQRIEIAVVARDEIIFVSEDGGARRAEMALSRKAPIVAAVSVPAATAAKFLA
jgi:hypothetical protein